MWHRLLCVAVVWSAVVAILAQAADKDVKPVCPVAVFPFQERGPDTKDLGPQVTDLLFASLVADPEWYLVAKIIGTETSRVLGESAKGHVQDDLGNLAGQLAGQVAKTVKQRSGELVAKPVTRQDRLAALKEKLASREVLTERTLREPANGRTMTAFQRIRSIVLCGLDLTTICLSASPASRAADKDPAPPASQNAESAQEERTVAGIR